MPIPAGGLIHKYDLGDPACYTPGSGTIVDPISGLNLTIYNSPTYDATYESLTWNVNGVGAATAIGTYANLGNTYTVSFWVRINNTSVTQQIFNNGSRNVSWAGWESFFSGTSGKQEWGANFVWGDDTWSPVLTQGQWYNFTFTWNTGTFKAYINGVPAGTLTGQSNALAYNVNSSFSWGSPVNQTTMQLQATYGVMLLYATELNGTQVAAIYDTYANRFLGPIHEYDFGNAASYPGGGSVVTDIGSSPINLSISGANFNSAMDTFTLTGSSGSYIRSAEPVSIGLGTNNFSYQLWFQYNGNSTPNDCQLQVGSRSPSANGGCNFSTVSGQLLIESPGVGTLATGFNPVLGKWYLLSLTVDGSNSNKLYVNGVLTFTGTQSYAALGALASIAMGPSVTNYGDNNLSGYGALQIYDRVISATEITDYYDSTYPRFDVGQVYLNASESYSATAPYTTWTDISNNYDFTMYNPSFTAKVNGVSPGYYSFPGRNFSDPLTVYGQYNGTPTITTEGTWTGYFWVRRSSIHSSYTQNRLSIFANGREDLVGGDNGWSYGTYNNPNAANDNIVIEAAGVGVFDSGDPMPNDTWVNIAYIRDSSNNLNWYLDGAYLGQISFTGYTTPADGMWISRTAGSYFSWIGDISIIREYTRALTGTELLDLINYDLTNYIINPTPPAPAPQGLVGGRTFGQGFAG